MIINSMNVHLKLVAWALYRSSDERFEFQYFKQLIAIVREVGLSLESLLLYDYFVVRSRGLLLRLQRAEVLLLAVDHDENLP